MLSKTLSAGLEHYKIGPKIRALRLSKQLGLVQLGKHTGLSPGMISKIERSQLFPTLPTLLRIALVFGVGMEHFFTEVSTGRLVSVVRKSDRIRLPDNPDKGSLSYFFENLNFPVTNRSLEAFLGEFPIQSNPSALHQHDGFEFIYVVEGELAVCIEGKGFALHKGDAIYFDSGAPHNYRRQGRSACRVIVIVAPS
jgi:transcriptional regulator with XRE-family HTH domain